MLSGQHSNGGGFVEYVKRAHLDAAGVGGGGGLQREWVGMESSHSALNTTQSHNVGPDNPALRTVAKEVREKERRASGVLAWEWVAAMNEAFQV